MKPKPKSFEGLGRIVNDRAPHPIASVAAGLLHGLARHPDELQVRDKLIGTILAIEIEAHPDDRPKLIGSRGAHIAAFSHIMRSIGQKQNLEVVVDLIVPDKPGKHVPQPPFAADPNWKSNEMLLLLVRVCNHLLSCTPHIEQHTLTNMTVFQVHAPTFMLPTDVLDALDVLFEAIGYKQGRVVHIAGPRATIERERTK